MKKIIAIFFLSLMLSMPLLAAKEGFIGRPITNNIWMQTGNTLKQGEFAVGIGPVGFGITDEIQVETNILLFLFQIYNFNAKVKVVDTDNMKVAFGLEYLHFDLSALIGDENNFSFDAIAPYVSVTTPISKKVDLHIGAQYSIISGDADIEDQSASSSVTGTSIMAGIDYSMSEKTKFLAEAAYDVTFEGIRAGGAVLFGWENFRLKLGIGYYAPGTQSFVLPVIGLWWRFEG